MCHSLIDLRPELSGWKSPSLAELGVKQSRGGADFENRRPGYEVPSDLIGDSPRGSKLSAGDLTRSSHERF